MLRLAIPARIGPAEFGTLGAKPAATQFVSPPWRHGTGFDTDTDILSGVPTHRLADLFRVRRALTPPQPTTGIVDDADRGQLLRHVQANVVRSSNSLRW